MKYIVIDTRKNDDEDADDHLDGNPIKVFK